MKTFFQLRTLLFAAVFAVVWALMYVFFANVHRHELNTHLNTHTAVLTTTYRASIDRFELATKVVFDEAIRRDDVLKTFADGIHSSGEAQQQARNKLYHMLLPLYRSLTAQGFQLVHFHTPDVHSFLRFHKPELHGDSLRDVRPSLVRANTENRIVTGFEMGRIKSGFRNVFPINYQGEHLGSVEFSVPFDRIRDTMTQLDKSRYYQLVLSKKAVYERLFEKWREQYPVSEIDPNFVIDMSLNEDKKPSVEPDKIRKFEALLKKNSTVSARMAHGDKFSIPVSTSGGDWAASFVPVVDTLNNNAGYFISFGVDPFITELRGELRNQLFVGTAVLMGLFLTVIMFYASRDALRREKQQLEVLMNTIGDGLYVLNEQGIVAQINSAFTAMLGYEADEIVGKIGHDIFHEKNALGQTVPLHECPIFSTIHKHEIYFGTELFLHKDGHTIHVEVDSRPIIFNDVIGSVTAFRDISERLRVEREKQAALLLLDSVIENIPITVFLMHTDDMRFSMLNKAGEELLGLDRSELLGKTYYETFPQEQADFFTAKNREALCSTEILDIPEEPVETRHRGTRVLHTKKLALRNSAGEAEYLLGISEDITELRKYRQHLEELVAERTNELSSAQLKYQRLLDDMGDEFLAFSYTPDGSVTYVSNNFEDIFGQPKEAVLGVPWTECIQWLPEDLEATRQGMRDLISEKIDCHRFEMRFLHPDGQVHTIYASTRLTPNAEGDHNSLEGILLDITERKRAENALQDAWVAAEAANRAKSAFLANMSHEIRTPMNGVIGMTDVLLNTSLSLEQRKMANVIRDSAQSQLSVLNDILDFSKIEAGKMDFSIETFALPDLMEKTCATLSGQARQKGVTLNHQVDPEIPRALEGAPLRVRQILANLISNAIKFSGGLERPGKVEVAAQTAGEIDGKVWVELSVRDNGIGMDAATLERVFHPFTQADASTTRKYGGTGLGLVISMRLTEAMGGEIRAESVPDVGSTFTVRMPFARADVSKLAVTTDTRDVQHVAGSLPSREEAIRQGRLVLVAEDNDTNQEVIRQQLALLGYQCDIAPDGREAFSQWLSGDYALVLSDIHMPNMDGYQLAEAIHREEAERGDSRTPILALTANVLEGEAERCQAAGMDGYLAKPVSLSQLMRHLVQWLPAALDENNVEPPRVEQSEELAVLDPAMLTRLVGGNPVIHRRLLEKFLINAQEQVEQLCAAIGKGDTGTTGKIAHSLKSSSRSVGAMQLGELCEALERAGKAGDGESCLTLGRPLRTTLDAVNQTIHSRLEIL